MNNKRTLRKLMEAVNELAEWHDKVVIKSEFKIDKCEAADNLPFFYNQVVEQFDMKGYTNEKKMVGLSLSLCVLDIMQGRVDIEEVHSIVSRTNAKTEDEWDGVVNTYSRRFWHNNSKAVAIVEQLRAEGRIHQPRTYFGNEVYPDISEGHWVCGGEKVEV